MGRMSREKGKRGELMLAKLLSKLFKTYCRRSQQYNGRGDHDVIGLPGLGVECKFGVRPNVFDAIAQARRDAGEGISPVVCARRCAPGLRGEPWIFVCELEELPAVVEKLYLLLCSEGSSDDESIPSAGTAG